MATEDAALMRTSHEKVHLERLQMSRKAKGQRILECDKVDTRPRWPGAKCNT